MGQLPSGNTTIQFTVTGNEGALKKFVLVRNGTTQVCDENLGTEVDVYITASLATLGRIWFGELSTGLARDKALLQIVGNSFYTNNLSKWLGISQFAPLNPNRQSG